MARTRRAFDAAFKAKVTWESIRHLIREGVCRKPESPTYLRLLARHGASMNFEKDPDVLEDAWKLFHHPTHAFEANAYLRAPNPVAWRESRGQTWPQVFYFFAHQGVIDRRRLIDEMLGALWREFDPAERAGLIRFHNLLAPMDEELRLRQSSYIELLRNPAGAVVAFALKVLKDLAKSESFDAESTVQALPAVFDLPSKSQPKSALSLLKFLLRKRPHLKPSAAAVVLRGLSRPENDIQTAAIRCFEGWDVKELPVEELHTIREVVSPIVQPRLDELVAARPSVPDSGTDTPGNLAAKHEFAERVAELRTRIVDISDSLNATWKLEESLAALEVGHMLPPVDIDMSPGVLTGLNEVTPIRDVEELIDAVARLFETVDSPMEIERVLDGLNRLGRERPLDFEARTNALRQRIHVIDPPSPSNVLLSIRLYFPSVLYLLESWLGINPAGPGSPYWRQPTGQTIPTHEILNLRAHLIRLRLEGETKSPPLLSFPTHEHGWIDPRVLVDRLEQVAESGAEPHRFDLRCGLLRLAPDFREEAIRDAARLPDRIGRIVRYALGDAVAPSPSDREWKAEWLAAGRVRAPHGRLDELEVLDLPDAANAIVPANFRVHLDRVPINREERQFQRYVKTEPFTEIAPAGKTTFTPAEYPVLVITQQLGPENNSGTFAGLPAWGESWLTSLWPSNPEPFLARAIDALLIRLDEATAYWEPIAPLLMPLLRPERAWSPTAIRVLWLTIFSRDRDARAVAVDALIEGLFDGRAHPKPLAEALVEIARYDWAKLNRLAESLRQVTRISLWGSLVISEVLDRLIASWTKPPRDAHHVLEIQLELLIELGSQLSDAARAPLESLNGSSKTATLAKQLLQLDGAAEPIAFRSALLEGIDIRLARAEQLQSFHHSCGSPRSADSAGISD